MTLTKVEAGNIINQARKKSNLSWKNLAKQLDAPQVWVVSAVLGQQPVPQELAEKIVRIVGLPVDQHAEVIESLVDIAYRGPVEIPSDPTLYRFFEALSVYGPALKELIYEEFGDGIMSAINFGIDMDKAQHAQGDRVVITMNGKFLPYEWPHNN